uniref:RNA-directed RNA polymerase n=1 Tax=Leviviridae sp. TaxID=2027243 RepID=A0A514D0R7_9VIRU|nr:MAG: hypothetical protein H2Rhizo331451_000002 [Leviviridae sp.]
MSDWIEDRSPADNLVFLREVSSLLSGLGGPLTRDLCELVSSGRYIDLINFKFNYDRVDDLRDVTLARQVHALFQKQEWMDLGLNPRGVAEQKFWMMEEKCQATNIALDSCQLSADVRKVTHRARRIINYILGGVPELDRLRFSFGPGATTTVKGRVANPRVKLASSLACSRELLPSVGRFLAEVPYWVWSTAGVAPVRIDLPMRCYFILRLRSTQVSLLTYRRMRVACVR